MLAPLFRRDDAIAIKAQVTGSGAPNH
jgi:hypothetical protein